MRRSLLAAVGEREVGQIGLVKPHGLNSAWEPPGERLKAPFIVSDDEREPKALCFSNLLQERRGLVEVREQSIYIRHFPAGRRQFLDSLSAAASAHPKQRRNAGESDVVA